MSAPPEKLAGYRETTLVDPFEIFVGPLYEKGEGIARRYALIVDERHVNLRGVIHGGMLMTLADMTLGQAAWDACDRAAVVTLSMQTQFLKGVRQGNVLEVTPQLQRHTRSMLFLSGDYQVNGETVFTASSVWKLLGQS